MRLPSALLATLLLTACLSDEPEDGPCVSQYEEIVKANDFESLKSGLITAAGPKGRSVEVVDEGGKRYVNVLNRREQGILNVEVWRNDDGSWTAAQWKQCID